MSISPLLAPIDFASVTLQQMYGRSVKIVKVLVSEGHASTHAGFLPTSSFSAKKLHFVTTPLSFSASHFFQAYSEYLY